MLEKTTKNKAKSVDHEMLCKLVVMIEDEHCTIEQAREELESNPEAFIEKVRNWNCY